MGVELKGTKNGSDLVELTIPAEYRYLSVVGACVGALLERVEEIEERDSVAYNIKLALHEICTNIVEHAYGGRGGRIQITIQLRQDPRRLVVELRDSGSPFDWASVREPDLSVPQESNYGLFLARNLLDELRYQREEGNLWQLLKYL